MYDSTTAWTSARLTLAWRERCSISSRRSASARDIRCVEVDDLWRIRALRSLVIAPQLVTDVPVVRVFKAFPLLQNGSSSRRRSMYAVGCIQALVGEVVLHQQHVPITGLLLAGRGGNAGDP